MARCRLAGRQHHHGAGDPQLAELHEKAVPLSELADVLEGLLVERFGARRRAAP